MERIYLRDKEGNIFGYTENVDGVCFLICYKEGVRLNKKTVRSKNRFGKLVPHIITGGDIITFRETIYTHR